MRLVLICVVVILIITLLIPSALAAEQRTTLIKVTQITQEATYLFSVGWERGELSVTLIAPDGTRISQDAPPSGVRVATSDRITIFRVENAQTGLWKAEFQEYDNGHVGVIVQKIILPLLVQDVFARQDGSDIQVDFSLDGQKNKSCKYDVYLTLDGSYQNGRLLESGTSETGKKVSLRCPGNDVSSHAKWYITVYAECEFDGFTDFHSASSESFEFNNPNAPGTVEILSATLLEDGLSIKWQTAGSDITGFLAMLYGPEGEMLHSVSLDAEVKQVLLPIIGEGEIVAAVSAVRDSICGLPSEIKVNTDMSLLDVLGFELPEEPSASNGYVELLYDTGSRIVPLNIEIDGQQVNQTLEGDGVLRLPIHNGTNRVTLEAEVENGIWISQSRRWRLDMIPPALRIFEDWDAVITNEESILLSGNVENGVVEMNGSTITTAENGNFSVAVPLEIGVNLVKLTAKDDSGNLTIYEARVTRKSEAAAFPWWLAGGLASAALIITVYALLKKRRARG